MKVDEELIRRVAAVSRLDLSEDEVKQLIGELSEVLKAFTDLKHVDTEGIEPAFHPIELQDHTRDDVATASLSQEAALSLAQHKKDGYFKGPKSIDK